MQLISGTRLGRYEIRSKIGVGGMGEVYLAQDTELERTVALKVLPADVAAKTCRLCERRSPTIAGITPKRLSC